MGTGLVLSGMREKLTEAIEKCLIGGDLNALQTADRLRYYNAICESLGLNPLTRPFEYINLQGKMVLYARRDCTDQLRQKYKVSVTKVEAKQVGELYIVSATVKDGSGRTDTSTGAVVTTYPEKYRDKDGWHDHPRAGQTLRPDELANAIMKAETKAKRRATLSLCGLGFFDESEVADAGEQPPIEQTVEVKGVLIDEVEDKGKYWYHISVDDERKYVVFYVEKENDTGMLKEQDGEAVRLLGYARGKKKGKMLFELAEVLGIGKTDFQAIHSETQHLREPKPDLNGDLVPILEQSLAAVTPETLQEPRTEANEDEAMITSSEVSEASQEPAKARKVPTWEISIHDLRRKCGIPDDEYHAYLWGEFHAKHTRELNQHQRIKMQGYLLAYEKPEVHQPEGKELFG